MGRLQVHEHLQTAPVSVAKLWDDLWLGVISQSSLVIAGFPRNVLKYGRSEAWARLGVAMLVAKARALNLPNRAQVRSRQT